MKRLPQGWWLDTKHNLKCRVVYYDSKGKCYRVETIWRPGLGGRIRTWQSVADFDNWKKWGRYLPPTAWDMLDNLDLSDGVARSHENHREHARGRGRLGRPHLR